MKKQTLKIFTMLGLLALVTVSAQAQRSNSQTAHIPFAFTVGDKTLPAGDYNITRVNPAADKAALAIKSADNRVARIVLTTPVQASTAAQQAKLIFSRYGDQYFLSQVWTPADSTGLELPKSRAERGIARNAPTPERTVVALNTRQR